LELRRTGQSRPRSVRVIAPSNAFLLNSQTLILLSRSKAFQ
jgi:hypothetical protein